jgi:hypothetical protein
VYRRLSVLEAGSLLDLVPDLMYFACMAYASPDVAREELRRGGNGAS